MKKLLLIIGAMVVLGGCSEKRICIKSHEETYYDNSGTALWLTTKNPGMLALNGEKIHQVCDEWKIINTSK